MQTSVSLLIDGARPADLFEHVATLDRYPPWMRLIHRVRDSEPEDGRPAWLVELRARVGPFARSKQLRMVRTVFEPERCVRFERVQDDERDHAEWILTATVEPAPSAAELQMDLEYSGKLWAGGVLQRILDGEIERGSAALRQLVTPEPMR